MEIESIAFRVSVLFNESKLLKFFVDNQYKDVDESFSTLQRVEIAEILAYRVCWLRGRLGFQYSSTSRNC